ncbi:hypothetical protein DY000_02018195 [Brassica cretica]|uniref:Uncharacterized protein n=1 Tax=Brassica cretica TaxID=69181 RepID=A0ABQ7CSY6_BRACR|nr:hypothetical protein DY000_02018195 [Brassica cretica]
MQFHRHHRLNDSTTLNILSEPPESPGTTTTKETSNDYVGRSRTTEHKAEPSTASDLNRKPQPRAGRHHQSER